jgi:hypothetical protein
MKRIAFKSPITLRSIREANSKLMEKGISYGELNDYGVLKININRGTFSLVKTISKEKLNAAFKDSISFYAEKL